MSKFKVLFLVLTNISFSQNIQFSDPDALIYLTTKICVDSDGNGTFDSTADFNNDDQISLSEAQQVTSLSFGSTASQIQNIGGFENFTNLEKINITSLGVSHLDFSTWPLLQSIKLSSSINSFVFNNPLLTDFELQNIAFSIPTFDLTNLPNLERVRIQSNFMNDNIIFGTHNNLEDLSILSGTYSSLNLTGMPSLKNLIITDFIGTSIDISNCTVLEKFIFNYDSNLSEIVGIGALSLLKEIDFSLEFGETQSNLDVSFNSQSLFDVEIRGANSVSISNNITNIRNIDLFNIFSSVLINNCNFVDYADQNQIWLIGIPTDDITLTNIENLRVLFFQELAPIENFDLSTVDFKNITMADCTITELNLKNGKSLEIYNGGSSSIDFICVDDEELSIVQNSYLGYEFPPVINTYCSFVLGGDYHEVQGNILINPENECVVNSLGPIFDIQFTVSDGENTNVFYPTNSNNYSYSMPEGNHTLSAQLLGNDLWTVTPSTLSLSFPNAVSPFIQDYCISSNSTFNDAEIVLIPLNSAQPGFQANYKIIYKNKGTTILSGNLSFSFDDNSLNFLESSNEIQNQGDGLVSWSFLGLMPFETREIDVTMALNTPTNPDFPLNSDDILEYNVSISPQTIDNFPENNQFTLNQVLVNSYDPNDITCLQGYTVTSQQIGKYIHYLIRFENNGTSNAVNVVVKDVIDDSKFDINSLVPISSSHNFYTRIVNNNEVEFIFESIQLPFNDDDNDGFILFKIKTLPTLNLGDSFQNQAEIYFDYNFPIITNIETTTINDDALSITEFNKIKISFSPNPSSDKLLIKSSSDINKILIFDFNGRLLTTNYLKSLSNEFEIDVNGLTNGIYFIEVKTIV